jgi:hypothetical protein
VEQDAASVSRSGKWWTVKSTVHSGGSYAYANASGASATFRFTGTGAKFIGPKYPHFGRLNYYVDGRYIATRSQYAARASYKQVLASVSGLAAGEHTFTVKWTGTRDSASHGTYIGIDALDVVAAP